MDSEQVSAALADFNVQGDSEGVNRSSIPWCYWKRKDGWIVMAETNPTEWQRQVKKGMTPLPEYGEFYLNLSDHNIPIQGEDGRTFYLHKWRPSQDPYRLILLKGGAHEFPLDQVKQLGWHRRLPIRGVTFPQLKGVDITDVECAVCHRKFLSAMDMQKHESVMHSTISSQNSQARLTSTAMEKLSGPIGEAVKVLAEAQAAQSKALEQQGKVLERLLAKLA